MQISDEIKAKLDIVEVLREYIQLKPAGTNFQALCPFHNEKTPSFVVSPEKQIWHCFGCGKGGDVFRFVMEKEGLDFVEALRLLAPKAGVVLRAGDSKTASLKTRALDALSAAADFYAQSLIRGAGAPAAREYLERRGLSQEIIEDWQIGYSPDSWDDLLIFLKGRGFNEREIEAAGLVSRGQSGSRFYNRFRGRIMFPIRDAAGQVVAFTARQIPGREDKLGKYINSPATMIYDKSKVLFGLDKAKPAIRDSGFAVVVEGQMDAITAHQFGFKNTVASSGTALTEEQLAQLARFAQTIVLALDADQAGQEAAARIGAMAGADQRFVEHQDRYGRLRQFIDPKKNYKSNIKVAMVPSGKDPDEAIRQSPSAWRQAVETAVSLAEFYFHRSLDGLDMAKLEDRKKAAARFLPFAARLEAIDKDYWVRRLAATIDTDAKFLYEALAKAVPAKAPAAGTLAAAKPADRNRGELLSESLLAMLIRFSAYIKYILDYVSPEQLVGRAHQALYSNLIVYYNESKQNPSQFAEGFSLRYQDFRQWLVSRGLDAEAKVLDRLAILAEKEYFAYTENQIDAEIKAVAKDLKLAWLNARRRELSRLIAEAEQHSQLAELEALVKELSSLNEELRHLL